MMRNRGFIAVALLCLLTAAVSLAYAASGRAGALPPAAARAVQKAFPNATVGEVAQEREDGVLLYEVNMREAGEEFELEVTAEGVIGEIESVVTLEDLPAGVAEQVRRLVGDGRIGRIERHERRGSVEAGRATPLAQPMVTYEVTYEVAGQQKHAVVTSGEPAPAPELPDAVRKTIAERFPDAVVRGVERDYALGIALFEVELTRGDGEAEAVISADGVLVQVESEIEAGRVPTAVVQALKNLAGTGNIEEIEKVEVHAVARLTPLAGVRTNYEASVRPAAGKGFEVLVSADGQVLRQQADDDDGEDDEADEEDDN